MFYSSEDANKRACEINSENSKTKKQKELLRPYKCDVCNNWHLTKMPKHQYKYRNDVKYRNEINEKAFIRKETMHWEDYFGIF